MLWGQNGKITAGKSAQRTNYVLWVTGHQCLCQMNGDNNTSFGRQSLTKVKFAVKGSCCYFAIFVLYYPS